MNNSGCINTLLPEELKELILSRRIDHNGVQHFQTLNGHLHDILKALYDFLIVHENALQDCSRQSGTAQTELCGLFFSAVGLQNFYKTENAYQQLLRTVEFKTDGNYRTTFSELSLKSLCTEYLSSSNTGSKIRLFEQVKINGFSTNPEYMYDFEQLTRYWRRLFVFYRKFNFLRWFQLEQTAPEKVVYFLLHKKHINSVKKTEGKKVARDAASQNLFDILQYCVGVCNSVADRAFLTTIFSKSWVEPYVIHGSALNNLPSDLRVKGNIFRKVPHSSALLKKQKKLPSGTDIDIECYFSYSERKRMHKAASWLTHVSRRNRIIIVAPTEEKLICIGCQLKREIHIDTYNFYHAGLVKFNVNRLESVDTKLLAPDSVSEPVFIAPAEIAAASLYTYQDFIRRFFFSDTGKNEFCGEVSTRSLLFCGVPLWNREMKEMFSKLLQFVHRNSIPALILLGGHEKRFKKVIRKAVPSIKIDIEDAESPVSPVLKECPYQFLEDSHTLHPEFALRLEKNLKQGINQLIIGPNPIYVQKMYYELCNWFSKKRLPVRSLELYHGLFELRDKPVKKAALKSMVRRGAAVVISTPSLFPDLFGSFPVMYAERLPFVEGITSLFEFAQEFNLNERFTAPHIYWSDSKGSPQKKEDFFSEIGKGAITPHKLEKLIKISDSSLRIEQDSYCFHHGAVLVIPYCDSLNEKELDAIHRLMYPVLAKSDYTRIIQAYPGNSGFGGMLESKDKMLRLLNGGVIPVSVTNPYHPNLGIIGPPEWMDEYIP